MKEPDADLDLCDFNEHTLSRLELRIHNLEHAKAVSEIVINKKGKKMADKKTTEEEIEDIHKSIKKLTKKASKMKDFREEFYSSQKTTKKIVQETHVEAKEKDLVREEPTNIEVNV
jgi:uncharacterized coiled-coil protein SlyX